MLLREVEVHVFRLTNDAFDAIGQVNEFTTLIWPDRVNGSAMFELHAPVTAENNALFKAGHIVWCGGDNAAVIEIVQSEMNDNGQKIYKVQGRTLEMLLTTRIIWGTYYCTNKTASSAMYEVVNEQCVSPANASRAIPFLECATDEELGKQVTLQKTGGEVYDFIRSVASDADLCFCVLFRPVEKKLIFKVYQGVDRSVVANDGDGASLVVFSTDLDDILSSSYYMNSQDVKTVAFVAGEGTSTDRVHVTSGDAASSGFARREAYVDARDMQSEVQNEDGSTSHIDPDDYIAMLNDRGNERLSECVVTESFEAKMRVSGDIQNIYGVDYFKGDKVLVQDTDMGVQVVATVFETIESFDDKYALDIVFGFSYPTLIQKIKRQIL